MIEEVTRSYIKHYAENGILPSDKLLKKIKDDEKIIAWLSLKPEYTDISNYQKIA